MAYDTYEEFAETMSDILSSGGPFELSNWHEKSIAKLFEGMDRDSVVEFANMFYSTEEPEHLRDGELGLIAELISKMEPSQPEISVDMVVTFR